MSRLVLATVGIVLGTTTNALATSHCDGPPVCCPTHRSDEINHRVDVGIGVVVVGMYNVNEKAGTWDADYYLYEHWKPEPDFEPQTEVVNELTRQSEQFDETELRAGYCVRTRRILSTLHNEFNLRRFPFDHQRLMLTFSDAEYDSTAVTYGARPYIAGLADEARRALTSWKLEGDLSFKREERAFAWEENAPHYDYATFTFQVRRHVTHHLIKFFLPLFIIVALAFLNFWIDPEDLSSQVNIGVTCILSAIAFQLVQASNLPEVAYTTLADRVYVLCYVVIALALAQSVYTNALCRKAKKDLASKIDRRSRWAFPLCTLILVVAIVWWSFGHNG